MCECVCMCVRVLADHHISQQNSCACRIDGVYERGGGGDRGFADSLIFSTLAAPAHNCSRHSHTGYQYSASPLTPPPHAQT